MRTPLLLAIGLVATLSPALSAAPSQARTTTASAPTSQPVRLLDKAMVKRAAAITALRPEPEFQRSVQKRRGVLKARLEAEATAEERVALGLGWANWELAEAAAPAATRWLMGYRTRHDLRQFQQAAESANRALDAAKRSLETLADSKDNTVVRQRARWRDMLETLRLFAAAYDALARAVPPSATKLQNAQDACREAALGLTELRENEDPDTAAAARLWQAVLLEAGSRFRRDMEILDLTLVPPERLPYDFFAHLLRCQILMDNGSYPLVAALTLRMEERCERWFGTDTKTALRAKLTLIAVRINCLWHWADALQVTDPAVADQQRGQADALATKDFPPDGETKIYRLDRAIPIYLEVPPAKGEPTSEQNAPASAPTIEPTTEPTSRNTTSP